MKSSTYIEKKTKLLLLRVIYKATGGKPSVAFAHFALG